MGKTIKGKNKVAAKKAAAQKKIARKCRGKCAALVTLLALAAIADGCAQSGPQPSRAIYQRFNLTRCVIVVSGASVSTNDTPAVEMFTATQANDGSETVSPTATPTLDVKTDITAKYNDAIQSASAATRSVLGSIGDGLGAVLDLILSKKTGKVAVTKTDGSKACVECVDGQCSWCEE